MNQDDALVGNEERHVHRFNLTPSHDAVPLKTFDTDDALARAPGDDESQYPLQSAAFSVTKGRIPATI
jgi:hypothetical protein